jgi:ribonuclease HII
MVKGDGTYQAIAAASILAKTYRDDEMDRLGRLYPEYDWKDNKGYPTRKHCDAIMEYGITCYHRKSYHFHGEALSDSDLKRNGRSLCGK